MSSSLNSSPFKDRLHSNYVPQELERREILTFLQEPERKMAAVSREISTRREALDRLTKERTRLQNAVEQHRTLLSPMRRLPAHILQMIFVFCLPDSHNALMHPDEPPLLLGRVCRRWRFVAYNSPQLWASLHIPFPTVSMYGLSPKTYHRVLAPFIDRMALHQTAIYQWLLRSGPNHPLSVSLHLPHHLHTFDDQYAGGYRTYVVLLVSVFPRLRALEVEIPAGDFSKFFASLTQEELPMLESLRLSFVDEGNRVMFSSLSYFVPAPHEDQWKFAVLLGAKGLRRLHLSKIFFRIPVWGGGVQWFLLTHLDIFCHWDKMPPEGEGGLSIVEAHQILVQCYHLVHLGMKVADGPRVVCPPEWVRLPFLKSITLLDAAYKLATLIDRFECPNLEVVRYQTRFCPSQERRSPLLVLLGINYGKTQKLVTNIEFLTLTELVWLFYFTPNLTHFRQERSTTVSTEQSLFLAASHTLPFDLTKGFLEFLIPDRDGRYYWHELEHIHIKGVPTDSVYDIVIERLIEGRRRIQGGAMRLKEVRIESEGYNPDVNSEAYARCTPRSLDGGQHGSAGVKVDFYYPIASRSPFEGNAGKFSNHVFPRWYPSLSECTHPAKGKAA